MLVSLLSLFVQIYSRIWVREVCNSSWIYNILFCVWAGVCLFERLVFPLSCLATLQSPLSKHMGLAWSQCLQHYLSWLYANNACLSPTARDPPHWTRQPPMPPSFTSFKPWTGRERAARVRPHARPAASDKQKPSSFCPARCCFYSCLISAIACPY